MDKSTLFLYNDCVCVKMRGFRSFSDSAPRAYAEHPGVSRSDFTALPDISPQNHGKDDTESPAESLPLCPEAAALLDVAPQNRGKDDTGSPAESLPLCPEAAALLDVAPQNHGKDGSESPAESRFYEKYGEGCRLCPTDCRTDRRFSAGLCRVRVPRVAKAMLHFGEEPVISGTRGSGTVFFSGCTMNCVFCQNHRISRAAGTGETECAASTPKGLAEIFYRLRDSGAHNINLVTATPALPLIVETLKKYPPGIPVVWNSSGYEKAETVRALEGLVQVWLPDLKYINSDVSAALSGKKDYFNYAFAAISEMLRQQPDVAAEDGIISRGVIVRHLIIPGYVKESAEVIKTFARYFKNNAWFSLMSQYTPPAELGLPPMGGNSPLDRRITPLEYKYAVKMLDVYGIENGFVQEFDAPGAELIPDFDKN
jgi:putative pyruvate formate lyase activating enzyme